MKAARYAMVLDFEQHVEPLHKTLSELVTQYLMHHPKTLQIRNIRTMSYIMILGASTRL
ncbi:hypothetical protein [Marinobacter salicampi]|uniref:hypothetical protein n=1 Tax=Marinobacter salicampi TaxID=435907 RepID=UPI00140E8BEE|nr:hypothetical protein [Marinobacter salicampi]